MKTLQRQIGSGLLFLGLVIDEKLDNSPIEIYEYAIYFVLMLAFIHFSTTDPK